MNRLPVADKTASSGSASLIIAVRAEATSHGIRALTRSDASPRHVTVLDVLAIERAHFFGSSWEARPGFAFGEHAPERVLSLVLCGNQPYAWDLESPTDEVVAAAIAAANEEGMKGRLGRAFESGLDYRVPEAERTSILRAIDLTIAEVEARGGSDREERLQILRCMRDRSREKAEEEEG